MIIYIDIDNTITITNNTEYGSAIPRIDRINHINRLYHSGHTIIYWTARGSGSGIDYKYLTKQQLENWGCLYHELKFNKPIFDLFIDDKAIESIIYFTNNL
jgi:dTDP-glucose 4,6-dehydratase